MPTIKPTMKPTMKPTTSSPATIRVLEFAYTAYPVTDVARARAFYEGVCGLKLGGLNEDDGKHAWIEYDVGGHTLALVAGVPEWKPSGDGPSLALEVEDFDGAMAALREAGAGVMLEPGEYPGCRMAVVRDPDGNALVIHRRKDGSEQAAG